MPGSVDVCNESATIVNTNIKAMAPSEVWLQPQIDIFFDSCSKSKKNKRNERMNELLNTQAHTADLINDGQLKSNNINLIAYVSMLCCAECVCVSAPLFSYLMCINYKP